MMRQGNHTQVENIAKSIGRRDEDRMNSRTSEMKELITPETTYLGRRIILLSSKGAGAIYYRRPQMSNL
jgi:hypothetical protein